MFLFHPPEDIFFIASRERGKERERNTDAREKHPSTAFHCTKARDGTCNPGMGSDWESNP